MILAMMLLDLASKAVYTLPPDKLVKPLAGGFLCTDAVLAKVVAVFLSPGLREAQG